MLEAKFKCYRAGSDDKRTKTVLFDEPLDIIVYIYDIYWGSKADDKFFWCSGSADGSEGLQVQIDGNCTRLDEITYEKDGGQITVFKQGHYTSPKMVKMLNDFGYIAKMQEKATWEREYGDF